MLWSVTAIGAVVVLGLIASLVGSLFFGWAKAPVPTMGVAVVYLGIAAIAVRLLLALSMHFDRRDKA
jgi:hypothetical protein